MADRGISDADLLARTGSSRPFGEPGYTNAERCSVRPTLDINGIWGGFTGEGSATIIPRRASAKVSMRLVAHQDHEKISAAFDRAVRQACPPAVKLAIRGHAGCGAYNAPADSPGMLAARKALEAGYGREPVVVREGGTLPILPLFKEILGADSVMLGFADPGCNLHSPDEFFHVRDLDIGTQCVLHFHTLIAQIPEW
jgi:acetylornithine deacetylase/succinyl-diaminopimelate desuccinylase-like protein